MNVRGAGWATGRAVARVALPVAEPGGHPAERVERRGVGPVAGSDQQAAARLEERAERGDLLGRRADRRWPARRRSGP